MTLHDLCHPGIIITELFPAAAQDGGLAADLVAFAADSGFYTAVGLADVQDARRRAAIRGIVSRARLKLTCWLARPQQRSGLSIAALDEAERRAAVRVVIDLLPLAAECGATHAGIQSGPDVAPQDRPRAHDQLRRSIDAIHRAVVPCGSMRLLLEPVERDTYRRYLIGPTGTAVDLVRSLRDSAPRLDLALDSAHARLQGEDLVTHLHAALDVSTQLHLSNCVADPRRPGFGDHHLPPGPPGYMDDACVQRLLAAGLRCGFFGPRRPVLVMEIAGPGGERSWALERIQRDMLIRTWQRVLEDARGTTRDDA